MKDLHCMLYWLVTHSTSISITICIQNTGTIKCIKIKIKYVKLKFSKIYRLLNLNLSIVFYIFSIFWFFYKIHKMQTQYLYCFFFKLHKRKTKVSGEINRRLSVSGQRLQSAVNVTRSSYRHISF